MGSKSNFPGIQLFRKVNFPGIQLSLDPTLLGMGSKSTFPGIQHYWEVNFPGIQLYWEVNFFGKSTLPGSQLYWEVNFIVKSTLRGSHFPGKPGTTRPPKLSQYGPSREHTTGSLVVKSLFFTLTDILIFRMFLRTGITIISKSDGVF